MSLSYLPWESPAAGTSKPCLGDVNGTLSYAEVEERAAAFAEQLAVRGLGAGDVLAIQLPNGLELLIGILAAWRVGAAATPVNPTFTSRELDYQLADSGAKLILASPPSPVSRNSSARSGSLPPTPRTPRSGRPSPSRR